MSVASCSSSDSSTSTCSGAEAVPVVDWSSLAPSSEEFAPFFAEYLPSKYGSEEEALGFQPMLTDAPFSAVLGADAAQSVIPAMERFIRALQTRICRHLEALEEEAFQAAGGAPLPTPYAHLATAPQGEEDDDGYDDAPAAAPSACKFRVDVHHRDASKGGMAGGSAACVLQGARVFEKAGVNISVICGTMPASRLHRMRADHHDLDRELAAHSVNAAQAADAFPFRVAGLSLVLHPHNPHVPTVHANYRVFEVAIGARSIRWFGGGGDLTPTYVAAADPAAVHFHSVLRQVCDRFEPARLALPADAASEATGERALPLYARFKRWCDGYFRLPHRQNESRGVGGIFFDDLDEAAARLPSPALLAFVRACGLAFPLSYFPIVRARLPRPFTAREKRFQQLRRGRYVEFNLMYDRGTKFGLEMPSSANVRTEAILMSLPLTARYEYCHDPKPGTREADTLQRLRGTTDWLGLDGNAAPAAEQSTR